MSAATGDDLAADMKDKLDISSPSDDEHECWLCLQNGDKQPLVRDCSCRGTTGL
jgi:hypothetical protein